jgi:AcrR family transcriptional regulator
MAEKISGRSNAQRTESRRSQVLDAAALCFRRSGFRGASMADISASANMSTGHIYHYFKSKEAIVEAIVERDQKQGLALIDHMKTKADALEAMIDIVAEAVVERDQFTERALHLEMLAEASRNPVVAAIMEDCKATMREKVVEVLKMGQAQGSVNDEIDPTALWEMILIICDGLVVQSAVNRRIGRDALLRHARLLLGRLLRAANTQPKV